jgi:uncharacterized coiled-coil protein SlyX
VNVQAPTANVANQQAQSTAPSELATTMKQAGAVALGGGSGAVLGYFAFSNPATGAVAGVGLGLVYAAKIARDDAQKRQEEKTATENRLRATEAQVAKQNTVIADLNNVIATERQARIALESKFETFLTQHNMNVNLPPSSTANNAQNVQQTPSSSRSM